MRTITRRVLGSLLGLVSTLPAVAAADTFRATPARPAVAGDTRALPAQPGNPAALERLDTRRPDRDAGAPPAAQHDSPDVPDGIPPDGTPKGRP